MHPDSYLWKIRRILEKGNLSVGELRTHVNELEIYYPFNRLYCGLSTYEGKEGFFWHEDRGFRDFMEWIATTADMYRVYVEYYDDSIRMRPRYNNSLTSRMIIRQDEQWPARIINPDITEVGSSKEFTCPDDILRVNPEIQIVRGDEPFFNLERQPSRVEQD